MERLTAMSVQSQYDLWHERAGGYEEGHSENLFPWHQTVIRLLPGVDGKAVLEVGCGRGDFSIWLARNYPGAQVTAVEFSAGAIAAARSRVNGELRNLALVAANAESLPFATGSFDLVISCECMEHVLRPARMAAEMARVLKPQGEFILTTENYFNGMVLAWLKSWIEKTPFDSGSGVQPHESFFLYWRVKSLLQAGGLQVEHMESSEFQWLLLPRTAPDKLCTRDFESRFWKRLLRPFGRHFTFQGGKQRDCGVAAVTVPAEAPKILTRKAARRGRVAVLLNSPYLYGMERAVIELFGALRPEIETQFLMSHVTQRENLPVLKEVERRGIPHVFMPDRKPWPRLSKPRSAAHMLQMIRAWARASLALFKMGAGMDSLYISSLAASPYAMPLAAYDRLRSRRVVHHFHDLRNNRYLMRMWAAFATDFVHNSKFCRETVLGEHPYLRKKRNHVLPYIVEPGAPADVWGADGGRVHVVMAGQVSLHKGVDYLLEAFARVAPDYPDAILHIAGNCASGYEQEFQQQLRAAQERAKVKFWGYVNNAAEMLSGAYLHVQPTPPSRFQESFPRAALEAMAAGVPTLCYRSGGLRDMIEDGVTGIVCEEESVEALANALGKFLGDPEFRDRCARNARERYLREYSAATLREHWLELLSSEGTEPVARA